MKNLMLKSFSFLMFMNVLFMQSCQKEKASQKCYQVKFIMDYCPKPGAVLVQFTEANTDATKLKDNENNVIIYQAALLNVPEDFHVPDKIFYVSYHYDEESDKVEDIACPTIFNPVKILVCDYTSNENCNM